MLSCHLSTRTFVLLLNCLFCNGFGKNRDKRQSPADLKLVYEFWDQLALDRSLIKENSNFSVEQFHTHSEIVPYLCSLETSHPRLVKSFSIGQSTERRPLQLVKIGYGNAYQRKHSLFIDAGFHAREWASVSSAIYLIDQILKLADSGNDYQMQNLLRIMDFYILPVANPDGYEYTWHNSSRRFWRKTRSPPSSQNGSCFGVDPNRNFPYKWTPKIDGMSSNRCQDRFPGPYPLSEPETRSVANYLVELRNNSLSTSYITLHAYARYWAVPYSYQRNTYPPHYSDLFEKATVAVQEIRQYTTAQNFVLTHSGNWYPAAGTSDDFAIGTLRLPYAYTIEVAPYAADSYQGFLLPTSQIISTGEEIFIGILTLCRQIYLNDTVTAIIGR